MITVLLAITVIGLCASGTYTLGRRAERDELARARARGRSASRRRPPSRAGRRRRPAAVVRIHVLLVAISVPFAASTSRAALRQQPGVARHHVATDCAGDEGITVPPGFCATIFADGIGHARHLVAAPNGIIYVNTWSGRYYGNETPPADGFLVALQDMTADGRAAVVRRFGSTPASGSAGGTGIAFYDDALFADVDDRIVRYPLADGVIVPPDPPAVVVSGLPLTGDHPMHPFAIDARGSLYVISGSATNACQLQNRIPGSAAREPCSELATRAGIWRYDAYATGQRFSSTEGFVTGLRNAGGIAVDPSGLALFAVQHGRDQLAENSPALYQPEQGANLSAEELVRVLERADYGWPECDYDATDRKLVLAPEYSGEGNAVAPCAAKQAPVAAFPAQWAPNDVVFYDGTQFPERYRGGAFVAFHGSSNRAPLPQGGYNVAFQPFTNGKASAEYEIFADGFAGAVKEPGRSAHRPAGLAVDDAGALYVADDVHGRIWRITYTAQDATPPAR